ncbi:hypothetical protein TUSST3_85610 [Streptomyces sp. TUS-ST3]|uniref:Pepco domain-containing protein n=1 Tax=Streptomyces sp. TUS-ST3 TaxID=3025591 RepID=UPI00235B4F16|nr:hypothetical protein [Streptomyces sp. TUS-ST3]GLP71942.1 hypothetical protein TUSST3_85610 [Streptomyces sp. TUS-ST3]
MGPYVEDPAGEQAAEELEFLVVEDEGDERRGSFKDGPRRGSGGDEGGRVRRQRFKPADLNVQLSRTLSGLREAFDGLQQAGPEGWGISEVQVSCQLTASGQLVVLGVGTQAQRTGGIQLTLTPQPAGRDGSER